MELRYSAKKFQVIGAWKARKGELLSFLAQKRVEEDTQVEFTNPNLGVEDVQVIEIALPEKIQKPITKTTKSREIILFDVNNNFIAEFKNQSGAIAYCMKEKICNSGWLIRSIRTEDRFYTPPEKEQPTKSQNSKCSGIIYFAILKVSPLETNNQSTIN